MSNALYGAFRTDTSLSTNGATYANTGETFQIFSYSTITITDGADASVIDGDNIVNETPNDPTQTYAGNAIAWDYTFVVNDGTTNYQIGMVDYDINGDGDFDYPTAEQGYFLVFVGDVPPLNTNLTFGAISDNGANLPQDEAVPCFTAGTLIETIYGHCPIETLDVGDEVVTMDNGAQTIRWIGKRELNAADLARKPKLRPIRIMAGALGNGFPQRDLLVSPQHRMLVRSPIVARMLGVKEILIAAGKLTDIPGIFVDEEVQSVTYFHVLFDAHEIVYAEGTPTESLYTGPQALNALGGSARKEIFTLFPEIATSGYVPQAARGIPQKGKQILNLLRRHIENQKALVAV